MAHIKGIQVVKHGLWFCYEAWCIVCDISTDSVDLQILKRLLFFDSILGL